MKLGYLFIFILFSNYLLAQNQPQLDAELIISVENNNYSYNVIAKMELISKCWNATLSDNNKHDITNLYPGSEHSNTSNFLAKWFVPWKGPSDAFGLGKYKLTVYRELIGSTVYIDYRTSAIPEQYIGNTCDLIMHFDTRNGLLYWDAQYTHLVESNFGIWDKTTLPNIKTELEPFKPGDLSISGNVNPTINWFHSTEEDYLTGYNIYRSIVQRSMPPDNFSQIATVSSNTTTFTDYDLLLGGTMKAYYKVAAINGNRESVFSNVVSVIATPYKISNGQEFDYFLGQNYPNPFNPTSQIKYNVKQEGIVKISLFDILGKEVKIFLNEIKTPGQYVLDINTENLPSGIYFYKMTSGEFASIKKMIKMK